ncbi:CreA family protein [Vibrio olivae]
MYKKLAVSLLLALGLTACDNNEVGDVSLGMFTMNDIKIGSLKDPIVTGVTCHIASIEADLSFSDPSDGSISCRQTGDITPEMISKIDKSKSGDVVFKKSKSIFFKSMKVRRIYDSETKLCFIYPTQRKKPTVASNIAYQRCHYGEPKLITKRFPQNKGLICA